MEGPDAGPYKLTERRIARLTLVIGALAAAAAWYFGSARMAAGVLSGALLAWAGFHWLESALDGRSAPHWPRRMPLRLPLQGTRQAAAG